MRDDQVQSGAQIRVDLLIGFAESLAALEGHPPFGIPEQAEEQHDQIVQPLEHAVQFRAAELLDAADGSDIAAQVL